MSRELRVLFGKEWKQALRNRPAVVTATFFPLLFLLIVPMGQAYAASRGMTAFQMTSGPVVPPGLKTASPEEMFSRFTFPLFLVMGGLVVPSVAATYTIVSEREKRTVDLLLALPLSLGQIIAAKLAAVVVLALAITLPMMAVDIALLTALGLADPTVLAGYLFELLGALTFSASSAVAVALLAKDYRAANNLNAALMAPMIFLAMSFTVVLPWWPHKPAVLGVLLLVAGLGLLVITLRRINLERFAL